MLARQNVTLIRTQKWKDTTSFNPFCFILAKHIYIVGNLILSIFEFIGVFVFFLTGELLLYLITFGKHSVRRSISNANGAGHYAKGQLYFEASYYIGIAFWITVIVAVNKYLF